MPTPLIVATWSFARRGIDAAWPALAHGGSSLDAVETVCRVAEEDEDVDSTGWGGLPDRDCRVTLDACVMLSPRECGAVCALAHHMPAVSVARRVMERTPHVLLAGAGADLFAEEEGFRERALVSPRARERWEKHQGHTPPDEQSYAATLPVDTGAGGTLFHDTIGAIAIDRDGVLAGACATSGLPYKRPGRVGDSPIIGHGLYVDPEAGAAVATGTGELVMGTCGTFLVVEEMRRGASPLDALLAALTRIDRTYALEPEHQVAMIAVHRDGRWSAAALRAAYMSVIADESGVRTAEPAAVVLA